MVPSDLVHFNIPSNFGFPTACKIELGTGRPVARLEKDHAPRIGLGTVRLEGRVNNGPDIMQLMFVQGFGLSVANAPAKVIYPARHPGDALAYKPRKATCSSGAHFL